jgi:hypothetical protein
VVPLLYLIYLNIVTQLVGQPLLKNIAQGQAMQGLCQAAAKAV